jgi:hypothetical protein
LSTSRKPGDTVKIGVVRDENGGLRDLFGFVLRVERTAMLVEYVEPGELVNKLFWVPLDGNS